MFLDCKLHFVQEVAISPDLKIHPSHLGTKKYPPYVLLEIFGPSLFSPSRFQEVCANVNVYRP